MLECEHFLVQSLKNFLNIPEDRVYEHKTEVNVCGSPCVCLLERSNQLSSLLF